MPTINDVAKRAGVSVGTVSNVINNGDRVHPTTREKVERAIAELGYVPNVVARSLRSKHNRWLALIVPDITNAYWHAVVRGVEDAAQSQGYAVLLGNTDDHLNKQQQYVDVAVSQSVAGVIIAPCEPNAKNLAPLRSRKIPTVTINRRIEGWQVDGVYSDAIAASRTLVRHLIESGHTRIAMISGPRHLSTVQDRIAGYCIALAEAGIPLDPRMLKSGDFQAASGELLTYQVLAEELNPTAIFAANNTIAKGVIDALGKRDLLIPHDIALVCFGDFAEAYFPFFTVILEPAYEMGMNAAQLLFSRLGAGVDLSPRQVVLPNRLVVRYSCGSSLRVEGDATPSLSIPKDTRARSFLVKPLTDREMHEFSECMADVMDAVSTRSAWLSSYDRPDRNRLLKALQHQESDRLPHLEFRVNSKPLYEYVLQREVSPDTSAAFAGQPVATPEDQAEFAQRLGMDAITCDLSWSANGYGAIKTWADLDRLTPPPSLADQLSYLERYLKAAQGTGLGVVASFASFFNTALSLTGMAEEPGAPGDNQRFVETVMDMLLTHQEKVIRAVCDRFGEDLAFILIKEGVAGGAGLEGGLDLFSQLFSARMARLIAPAKEHGKLAVLHIAGYIAELLPLFLQAGFNAVHPLEIETSDVFALRKEWQDQIAFIGGFPLSLLINGSKDEIEDTVKEYCRRLAPGGGYVLGSSGHITGAVPPENFVAMTQAVHKYGHYSSLDGEMELAASEQGH